MIKTFIDSFVNLLFPEICVSCGRGLIYGERMLCTCCLGVLPEACYGMRGGGVEGVVRKFYGMVPVWWGSALFRFGRGEGVRRLLHAVKYGGRGDVARVLGVYYGGLLKGCMQDGVYDVVVAVPLHAYRLVERGYNQSGLFARGLAEGLGLPYCEGALVRCRYTGTQTRRGRGERWANVDSAFVMGDGAEVAGRGVLLVDDVVTTGATLVGCSRVLLSGGAREVGVVVLAVGELD